MKKFNGFLFRGVDSASSATSGEVKPKKLKEIDEDIKNLFLTIETEIESFERNNAIEKNYEGLVSNWGGIKEIILGMYTDFHKNIHGKEVFKIGDAVETLEISSLVLKSLFEFMGETKGNSIFLNDENYKKISETNPVVNRSFLSPKPFNSLNAIMQVFIHDVQNNLKLNYDFLDDKLNERAKKLLKVLYRQHRKSYRIFKSKNEDFLSLLFVDLSRLILELCLLPVTKGTDDGKLKGTDDAKLKSGVVKSRGGARGLSRRAPGSTTKIAKL